MCDSNENKEERLKSLKRKNLKLRAKLETERLIYMVAFGGFGASVCFFSSDGDIVKFLGRVMIGIALFFAFTWEVEDEL